MRENRPFRYALRWPGFAGKYFVCATGLSVKYYSDAAGDEDYIQILPDTGHIIQGNPLNRQ